MQRIVPVLECRLKGNAPAAPGFCEGRALKAFPTVIETSGPPPSAESEEGFETTGVGPIIDLPVRGIDGTQTQ